MDRVNADEWTVVAGDRVLPMFGPGVVRARTISPTPITILGTRESDGESVPLGFMQEGYQHRQLHLDGFSFVTFDPADNQAEWSMVIKVVESAEAMAARAKADK